jgi:hypothetical protein
VDNRPVEVPLSHEQLQCLMLLAFEWDCSPDEVMTRVLRAALKSELATTGVTDEQFQAMLEQGSLGSPAARHIRSRTDLQTGMLSALRRFEQEQIENSQGDGHEPHPA